MEVIRVPYEESEEHGRAVTPEHAVKFKLHPELKRDDYIRFVHELIGGNHIHSVFDNGEIFKVYLTDKGLVYDVVNSEKSLKGVVPEFNVPPGLKITFLNVDPVIPDKAIRDVMQFHGWFYTRIYHEKLSTEDIFSHIITSTRYFYMSPNKLLPNKITVEHEDQLFEIDLEYEPEVYDMDFTRSNIDRRGQPIPPDSD